MAMNPEEKKRLRREETRDSAAALIEDLAFFREVVARPEQSPGELRRLSVTARRLLADEAIKTVGAPRTGVPTFRRPDNREMEAYITPANCQMFASLGVSAFGFYVHAMSARADDVTTPVPVHDPNAFIEGTIAEFMGQPVIFSEGVWVTRREVIKYIANVKDGAHSGGGKAGLDHVKAPLEYARRRTRIKAASGGFNVNMVEPTGTGFDPAKFPYDAAAVDVVLLELLAAVHLTVRSSAVRALEEYVRNELGS
jgi:hypothetical protein